jgi:hypothetical protein
MEPAVESIGWPVSGQGRSIDFDSQQGTVYAHNWNVSERLGKSAGNRQREEVIAQQSASDWSGRFFWARSQSEGYDRRQQAAFGALLDILPTPSGTCDPAFGPYRYWDWGPW